MTQQSTELRSRRSLLTAVTAGAVAYVAHALGRPDQAAAGTIYVELGGTNDATSTTVINSLDPGETGLVVSATGNGPAIQAVGDGTFALHATSASSSAIFATSTSGYGVYGDSENGRGVGAVSDHGHGLFAQTFSPTLAAAVGSARGEATGVLGHSGPTLPPGAPLKTGVYGYAAQDGTSSGVTGESTIGTGVRGTAGGGTAVRGFAQSGIGVYAEAGGSGIALRTIGRLEFDASGHAPVSVGTRSVTIPAGYAIDAASRVLCTLESNQVGLSIHRVVKTVATSSFKVVLSDVVAAGKTAKVAWLLIG